MDLVFRAGRVTPPVGEVVEGASDGDEAIQYTTNIVSHNGGYRWFVLEAVEEMDETNPQ